MGVWAGIKADQPAPAAESDIAAMPMLARDPRRADRIQIVQGATRLDLERRGQVWCLAQNGGYPVKPALGERLVDQLLALQLSHPTAPAKPGPGRDDPNAGLTGIRVLAVNGAGLGAIVFADHDPGATIFPAHQLGDPRDWQAVGALAVSVDPLAWLDPRVLVLDPADVTGAMVYRGTEAFALDAAAAAGRRKMVEGLEFADVHPAAQMLAAQTGRLAFTLSDGRTLAVDVHADGDQIWLAFQATSGGVVDLPPGAWLFRYPAVAGSLLQPPS